MEQVHSQLGMDRSTAYKAVQGALKRWGNAKMPLPAKFRESGDFYQIRAPKKLAAPAVAATPSPVKRQPAAVKADEQPLQEAEPSTATSTVAAAASRAGSATPPAPAAALEVSATSPAPTAAMSVSQGAP